MPNPYFRQVPNFEYVNRTAGADDISNFINVKNLFKRGKLRSDIFGNVNFFTKYKVIGDERPDNVAFKLYQDPTLDWVVLLSNNIINIQDEWPLPQLALDEYLLDKYGSYDELHNGVHHYETKEVKDLKGAVVLQKGLKVPSSWRSNGNFTQTVTTKINQIFGTRNSKTISVTMYSGIKDLTVGDQVLIENISETSYNGRFVVKSILAPADDKAINFTYDLPSEPSVLNPTLSGKEQALFTISGKVTAGNASNYEYFDGSNYNTIAAANVITPITNYNYEITKENNKRNIYCLKPEYLNIVFNDMDDIMPYKKGADQFVTRTLKKAENIKLYQ